MDDLKIIKKKYGEKMMHFAREHFPTLLEKEGLLSKLFLTHFAESHILYDDLDKYILLDKFKNYIYSLVDVENNCEIKVTKTPEELLKEVGYDLFECKSEEDIQSFKKYYAKGEELCTFNGGRLNICRVFFAVKKNVFAIKRENFPKPERQDEYGTSVLSIQFDKVDNRLSIKNRYNHHVNNPDSTFSNNLDNIVPSLTQAFAQSYGIVQKNSTRGFEIPNYTLASDGKFYKYNHEINNVYYCPSNIIINNGKVIKLPKEKYIVFDNYILDLVNKKFLELDYDDSFIASFGVIKKIEIKNYNGFKKVLFYREDNSLITLVLDNENNIIEIDNPWVKEIGDNFLYFNRKCQKIKFDNVVSIGNNFLRTNKDVEEVVLNNVESIGDCCLPYNSSCLKVYLPKATYIGNDFLYYNTLCQNVFLPRAKIIGCCFMRFNEGLKNISLPNVELIGNCFLQCNKLITSIYFPKLKQISRFFLDIAKLEIIILPQVEKMIPNNLKYAKFLYAPSLIDSGCNLILYNIPYCYTPLIPDACNTVDFLQDKEISLKLERKLQNK